MDSELEPSRHFPHQEWLTSRGTVRVIPNAYMTVSDIAKNESRDIIPIETEKLGVTHIDVGVALLEKWGIPGLIIQCLKMHHATDHSGPMAIETRVVAMANQLSRHSLPDEEDALTELLSTIPDWEESKYTAEQVVIACGLAEDQWLDVMESLGMLDLYEEEEDPFLFNTTCNNRVSQFEEAPQPVIQAYGGTFGQSGGKTVVVATDK